MPTPSGWQGFSRTRQAVAIQLSCAFGGRCGSRDTRMWVSERRGVFGVRLAIVRALLFDVQVTAMDFFTTVRSATAGVLGDRYPQQDWSAFVNEWHTAYFEGLKRLTPSPGGAWTTVDSVYRRGACG